MWNLFKSSKVDTRDSIPTEVVEERAVTSASVPSIFTAGLKAQDVYGISTSYACIRLLANTVAMTDMKNIRDTDKGEEILKGSRLTSLLKNPEPNVSYFQFMQNMTNQVVGQGNAYAIIIRDGGVPIELLYVPEDQVQIYETLTGPISHYYQFSSRGKSFSLFPEDVLHFRNITENGYTGLSPLSAHRLTFDAASSMQDYNKTFMDNATNISGIITTDKNLNKETVEELRSNFGKKFGGASQAGRTPVLSNGMTYTQMKVISPLDADYIATRKMSKADIAEIYGVPLTMLGTADATYQNAEQQALIYTQFTINPILEMIAQEMSMKLIPTWRNSEKLEFRADRFKLTPSKERAETVSLLNNTGIITSNEARELYGYKKLPGGDKLKTDEPKKLEAPKNTDDTNGVATPATDASVKSTNPNQRSLDTKEDVEREIQLLKSKLGRMR